MTIFYRSEHYRTSKNGKTFRVKATQVDRDDWSRGSSTYTPIPKQQITPKDSFLERYPEFKLTRRVTACFVTPNATCPVCGDRVFYYQNENGSRVFFDELGPPWPKHPCTDTRFVPAPIAGDQSGQPSVIRSQPVMPHTVQIDGLLRVSKLCVSSVAI